MSDEKLTSMLYDRNQIQTIIDHGFNYHLPGVTVDMIAKLVNEVGAPTYNRTPIFTTKKRRISKKWTVQNGSYCVISRQPRSLKRRYRQIN